MGVVVSKHKAPDQGGGLQCACANICELLGVGNFAVLDGHGRGRQRRAAAGPPRADDDVNLVFNGHLPADGMRDGGVTGGGDGRGGVGGVKKPTFASESSSPVTMEVVALRSP